MSNDLVAQYLLGQLGQRGQRQSPQSAMAARLMEQGASTAPVYSPMAGLARALTGAVGGWQSRVATQQDDARREDDFQRITGHQAQQDAEANAWSPYGPAAAPPPQGAPAMPAAPADTSGQPPSGYRRASGPISGPAALNQEAAARRQAIMDDPNLTPEQQAAALAAVSADRATAGGTPPRPGGYRANPGSAEAGRPFAGLPAPSGIVPPVIPGATPNAVPTSAPGQPPAAQQFDMRAIQEGLGSRNPLVRQRAQAALQVMQAQRQANPQTEIDRLMAAAGLQPGTPEYQAAARSILDRRGQPPSTTVNVAGGPQIGAIPPGYQAVRDGEAIRMEPIPGGPVAREQAREQGNALRSAEETLGLIDGVLGHRALAAGTGLTGQFANAIPGTPTYDFGQRVGQLQGRAFLQAFESLKGGGQITEVEGRKATEAIARLSTAQSAEDFRASLGELREIVEQARIRAGGRPQANLPGPNGGPINPPPNAGRVIEYDAQGRRVTR